MSPAPPDAPTLAGTTSDGFQLEGHFFLQLHLTASVSNFAKTLIDGYEFRC